MLTTAVRSQSGATVAVEKQAGELCPPRRFARHLEGSTWVPSAGMVAIPQHTSHDIAYALATAVVGADWPALSELLHDEVDFRGLTAVRAWLAVGPDQVCAVLRDWAAEEGRPAKLGNVSAETIADRRRVSYCLTGEAACEHTVYFDVDEHARITFMRMLSSGGRRRSTNPDGLRGADPIR
jgi:hypothetical protein